MGGAGALMLGLLHPDLFGGISLMGCAAREPAFLQPYLELTGEAFRTMAMADRRALPTEYGNPADGITLKEINTIARYATVRAYVNSMECTGERFPEALAGGSLPEIFFCCGDQDDCCPKVRQFVSHARELGARQAGCEILAGRGHGDAEAALVAMLRHFWDSRAILSK